MPSLWENIASRFGKKEINAEDLAQIDNMITEAENIKSEVTNDFKSRLKVEGIKQNLNTRTPQIQELEDVVSKKIDIFFLGMVKMDDYLKYKELQKSEGFLSSGEPFKCYAELDGNGNIIVTPSSMISIDSKDRENAEYSETRVAKDGSLETIGFKRTHGEITGCSSSYIYSQLSPEEEKKYQQFCDYYQNPNNLHIQENKNMDKTEKEIYYKELDKLGVKNIKIKMPENMTKEEWENSKNNLVGISNQSMRYKNGKMMIANYLYIKGEETPEMIWSASSQDGSNAKINSYRKTKSGKYIDTSSFTIINGQPVYILLEYDEIANKLTQEGIQVKKLEKMKDAMVNGLGDKTIDEAEKISKQRERKIEQNEETR